MNRTTWEGMTESQKGLLNAIFGKPEMDANIPDGIIRVSEQGKTEQLPVAKVLAKAERLALAKSLREELARKKDQT